MKHPALARVFSVVLTILSLMMAANGAVGLRKAESEREDRLAYVDKYQGRIENYLALDEELSNSISYDEALEAFQKMQEQHDKDASQHRTDTALYTAEKGGNLMGADLIWEAMPELKSARLQMDNAKRQFDGMNSAYNAVNGDIQEIAAQARNDAANSGHEGAALQEIVNRFATLLSAEPKLPEGFSVPEEPGEPVEEPAAPTLTEPTAPEGARPEPPVVPGEDADDETLAAYQAELEAYEIEIAPWNQYDAELAEYNGAMNAYEAERAAYETYLANAAAYEAAVQQQAEYDAAHAAWEEQVVAAVNELPLSQSIGALENLGQDLQTLADRASALYQTFSQYADGLGGMSIPGVDPSVVRKLSNYAQMDPSTMTEEQLLAAAKDIAATLQSMSGAFSQISGGVASIDGLLAKAKAQLDAADRALKQAEGQVNYQLAMIWLNLGELEKDAERLAEEKLVLADEAELLSKKLLETDELRDLKNRHATARQLLVNVPEIKALYLETDDLAASAASYLTDYGERTQQLYHGKQLLNILAIIGGLAGVAGIPAAFEKTRSRFLLIVPVLLCLGCAVGADGINMNLGLGQMYTALVTAIFALIQLLTILPKQKTFPADEAA